MTSLIKINVLQKVKVKVKSVSQEKFPQYVSTVIKSQPSFNPHLVKVVLGSLIGSLHKETDSN